MRLMEEGSVAYHRRRLDIKPWAPLRRPFPIPLFAGVEKQPTPSLIPETSISGARHQAVGAFEPSYWLAENVTGFCEQKHSFCESPCPAVQRQKLLSSPL